MQYTERKIVLPTFYHDQTFGGTAFYISRQVDRLESNPIKALHYHNNYEIGICLAGRGKCHVDNRIYRYEAPCIEIIPPGVPHLATSDVGVSSLWKWLTFDPVRLLYAQGPVAPDEILAVADRARGFSGVYSRDELGTLSHTVDMLIDCLQTEDSMTELSAAFAVGNFLIGAARRADCTASPTKSKLHAVIADAIDYISVNLDSSEMLSEPVLAARYNMSISNFRRLFSIYGGMSPKTFILRSRMAQAEYLLRKTDLSILEISARVGYGNISGFNRIFKRTFSHTPREWRVRTHI